MILYEGRGQNPDLKDPHFGKEDCRRLIQTNNRNSPSKENLSDGKHYVTYELMTCATCKRKYL